VAPKKRLRLSARLHVVALFIIPQVLHQPVMQVRFSPSPEDTPGDLVVARTLLRLLCGAEPLQAAQRHTDVERLGYRSVRSSGGGGGSAVSSPMNSKSWFRNISGS
jgi:hypothetical protein